MVAAVVVVFPSGVSYRLASYAYASLQFNVEQIPVCVSI